MMKSVYVVQRRENADSIWEDCPLNPTYASIADAKLRLQQMLPFWPDGVRIVLRRYMDTEVV